MKNLTTPRVLIGATGSGVGKTTVVCAILKALKNRKKKVVSFKCGPDYIDPMFHRRVLDIPSSNLDLFFNDKNTVRSLMADHIELNEADIAVVEGVMGYYDGLAGISSEASSYDLAKATDTPGILIVDGRGKSVSILAEIKGFLEFEENSHIKGVIINRMSPMMYKELKSLIEDRMDIKVLGFLPKNEDIALESRHLGLVTAEEIKDLDKLIDKLGTAAEEYLDIDGILELAALTREVEYEGVTVRKLGSVNIAIAMDKAFSFYYDANLRLLEKMGANLKFFSPVNQERLPEDSHALIIGGGYPELYLKELENNEGLKEDIRICSEKNMPILAECGGFMYLHQWIEDEKGVKYNMAGLIEGGSFPTGKLGRFGYIDVETLEDTVLGKAGVKFKAHEFHYWDSENPGDAANGKKPLRKRNWNCIHSFNKVFAGYPHIHYFSNIKMIEEFYKSVLQYKENLHV